MIKECKECKVEFTPKHKQTKCCSSNCKRLRKNRQQQGYKWQGGGVHRTKSRDRTVNGFLIKLYRNMRNRINMDPNDRHAHMYEGLEILPKEEFFEFALNSDEFLHLFSEWEQSGYQQVFTPSPDRLDGDIGYLQSNIEWVTHSENSRRGALSRWGII